MPQPSLLIREIERIARERGWSIAMLAEELGLSAKSFYNLRLGFDTLSVGTLSRIDAQFGRDRAVHGLIHHFLTREYPALGRARRSGQGRPADLPAAVPYKTRWRLVAWLKQLPSAEGPRRGLFLLAADPTLLSTTARYIAGEAARSGCSVVSVQANTRLSASEMANAEKADLVVVERLDHVSDAVAALLEQRGNAFQSVILTSCVGPDRLPDARLVRTVRATTRMLRLAPVQVPSPRRRSPSPSPSS